MELARAALVAALLVAMLCLGGALAAPVVTEPAPTERAEAASSGALEFVAIDQLTDQMGQLRADIDREQPQRPQSATSSPSAPHSTTTPSEQQQQQQQQQQSDELRQCCICLERLRTRLGERPADDELDLSCGHAFHEKCLESWFRSEALAGKRAIGCPYCRETFVTVAPGWRAPSYKSPRERSSKEYPIC